MSSLFESTQRFHVRIDQCSSQMFSNDRTPRRGMNGLAVTLTN
jgi:hypothetical protein